ncbi:hypothetical protein UFOVP1290_100 [uncultured Caudovirales phage]|uniref:Uncharacterized protein n=1 Tax=uncultured Caudovirales phage TaxID=2100421 RepID=A0A6J5RG96_9CAUD|nr:hypothetical protein UFOVP1290_100 [uncultured Caudovirales phage]
MDNELLEQEELIKKAEADKKARAIKKAAEDKKKKLAEPPPKFYYDIKVECMLPATLTYRVLAETPEKAIDLIKGQSPTSVKHRLIGRKEIKLMVYKAGCSMIMFVKNLFGK